MTDIYQPTIACPKCGEVVYEHMLWAHDDKDHAPELEDVYVEPMYASELVYGYESHDDYIELGRFYIHHSEDAWSFGQAEEEARDLAHMLIEDEWSGWYRIDRIERVMKESGE